MKHVKRLFAPAFGVAMVAALLVALPAQAKTIEVSAGQSIQAALDSANAGDTIVVHPGVYRENVHIDKDDITLRGSGASSDGTVLVSPPKPKGPFGGNGITILGKVDFKTGKILRRSIGVHVSGFLVKGFRDFGIFAYGASKFVIAHNKALNNGEYGISGFHLHVGRYLYNDASGSGEAAFYTGDSPQADFVIRGNSASDSGFGFLIRDASHGTVADNKVFGNCTGIAFLNTGAPGPVTGWRATDNDVYHNDRFCPGGDEGPARSGGGIGLIGSTKVVVGHNKVWANHPSKPNPFSGGIIAASSKAFGGSVESGNRVRGNQAYRNQVADIVWDGKGSANKFSSNKCDSSKPGGLCT